MNELKKVIFTTLQCNPYATDEELAELIAQALIDAQLAPPALGGPGEYERAAS